MSKNFENKRVTPDRDRKNRALCSLEGLSVGDSIGAFFEFSSLRVIQRHFRTRVLPNPPWNYTDDTNMAISVVDTLCRFGEINEEYLANDLAKRYDAKRGYGISTRSILARIRKGEHWSSIYSKLISGDRGGSYGNGGASRVGPIGAYFADDMDLVVEEAGRSVKVTHQHPEALAGATAVAVSAAWAWRLRNQNDLPSTGEFLDLILPFVPTSLVSKGLQRAQELPRGSSPLDAVSVLGNGSKVSSQDTVPFALWSAAKCLGNFEDAIWLTLNGGGDCDTTCAITGSIVAMHVGISQINTEWLANREPLPVLEM